MIDEHKNELTILNHEVEKTPVQAETTLDVAHDGPSSEVLCSMNLDTKTDPKPTKRQAQIMQLVAEGLAAKEISGQLGLSTRTVEFHRARIQALLGAKNAAHTVYLAFKHGLIQ